MGLSDRLTGRTIVEVVEPDGPGAGPVSVLVLDDGRQVLVEVLADGEVYEEEG